jgi:hypothetical protein
MTILPVDHYGDYKINSIVFILGENVAKYKDVPYGWRSAEIKNCHQEALLTMKVSMLVGMGYM